MYNYNESLIKAKIQQAISGLKSKDSGTARLPPGQRLTAGFPVLDLGVRIPLSMADYKLEVTGNVNKPHVYNSQELLALPAIDIVQDFHCVTRWSRYDLKWKGVPFSYIASKVEPQTGADFVVFRSRDGYTTNLSIADCLKPGVIIAYELESLEIPLIHGGPVRMIVPHLYGWKSAKFLTEIKFVKEDIPGFWETRGYHNHGDPWKEERYS